MGTYETVARIDEDSRFRPGRAYAIVAVIAALVVSQWFRAGTFIATGDMGPFIRRGWAPEMSWSWNHQITGAGSAAHTIGRSLEFGLINFVGFFGADETVAQWLFYTIIYIGVGVGVAYAAGALVRNNAALVIAGTFGILNGFFLTRLPNPLNIISVATVAFLTGLALRVALGKRIPAAWGGIALLPASFLAFNPPMLVVAFAWAGLGTVVLSLLLVGWAGVGRLLRWLLLAGPLALLLNIWWLLPLAGVYTGGGGPESNSAFTDPTTWSWATINNTVPNILTMVANWAWERPQYLPFAGELDRPAWIWVRYLLPALVFLTPLLALARRRRMTIGLLGLSAVFVFLAKGINAPFAEVNLWLYQNVPGFWLFREPMSKLGQLLIVMFAILLAIGVEGAAARVRAMRDGRNWVRIPGSRALWGLPATRTVLAGLGGAVVLLGLIYPHPLATGAVIPDERPMQPSAHVRVPDYWREMATTIDSDPRPGKVLVLPLDDYYQMPTTWGFFGVDSIANLLIQKPVVQPKPDGYFGDVAGFKSNVTAVETALLSGDLTAVPRLLDAIGVSEVIVRHDLVRGLPGRTFADDEILAAAIARVPGMTQTVDGPLELWETNGGTSPEVRLYEHTRWVANEPLAASAVLGSVGTSTAAKPKQRTEPAPTTPTVVAEPLQTDDSIVWPVPAVDSGPAETEITVTGGTYELAQRARAAAVLTPQLDATGQQLILRDATEVRINDEVVSQRPDLVVDLPEPGAVAIKAASRTVSLDGWGRENLPRPAGTEPTPATVPVGSATPLTVYRDRGTPVEANPMTPVYDCNNYEPRPAEELGLEKITIEDPAGDITRLTALDHAACTRIELTEAEPGNVYRIRLEYRQVEGKRPQICVWQVGTDGCDLAPRAQLNGEWVTYEKFVTVDEVASGVQLVLHADVGERLAGRTTTDYRNVTITALEPILEEEIWPPEVPQRSIELPAGTHKLSVTGGQAGSIMAPFEPLQDCFRYDDQTMEEAGLAADIGGDPNNPEFVLSARDHMACLGATLPDMGGSSLYEMSLEAVSLNLRDPKFCLYLRGPDSCVRLPVGGPWDEWTRYETLVTPSSTAVETRVYLYGRRDLNAQEVAQVGYRDVKVRPTAAPVSVVLVRQDAQDDIMAERSTEVSVDRANPTKFTVSTTAGGQLALAQTYAPGWQLTGTEGQHSSVQGWMNSWDIAAATTDAQLGYQPSRIARLALYLLPLAIALTAASMIWSLRRSRRLHEEGRPDGYTDYR